MESDSWSARLSSVSKRYQSAIQSRTGFDVLMGFEEMEGDDDTMEEFPCPFCAEYYDIVGLCCHIDDEHSVEAKNGRKSKSRKSGSHSTLSFLRKEIQEVNLQSLFGGSSCLVSSSNAAPDPLSSFILPTADDFVSSQTQSSTEASSANKGKEESLQERSVLSPSMSIKDQEERARRSAFAQDLLLSTIFDGIL